MGPGQETAPPQGLLVLEVVMSLTVIFSMDTDGQVAILVYWWPHMLGYSGCGVPIYSLRPKSYDI